MYDNTIQSTNKSAVVAEGLGKRYDELWALRDVDLEVPTGSILGLLGRNDLWELLRELVRDGATLVLTTQYLEEADRLADNIVLLDHGRVAATGSPSELKARIGGERIAVTVASPDALESAASALAPFAE